MKLTSVELGNNYRSPSFAGFSEAERMSETRGLENSDADIDSGDRFYNPAIYGGLRKGGAVKFFSRECLGLVAATFSSAFSLEVLNVVQPMLSRQFNLTNAELLASQRLTQIPLVFSFFFGLLSDCYPILGLRRKAYMMVGVATTVVSLFVMAGLSAYVDSLATENPSPSLAGVIIAFAALASFGNIITYVCVHTRVIELSQREPLGLRGSIQATYLCSRCVLYMLADGCVYAVYGDGSTSLMASSTALLIFGFVIALPMPIVIKFWEEKRYSLSTPMKTRGQILWRIMQQKAVWNVLAFTCFFTLFLNITFNGPKTVLSTWAGAADDHPLLLGVISYLVMLLTIVVWRYYFMNRPWRTFFSAAPVLLILPQLVLAFCVSLDGLRDHYFYRVLFSLTYVSHGVSWLGSMAPLTEIIQEGSEGAMVGLTLSLYFLVTIFVQTNTAGLFQGDNFYDADAVAADTGDAREDVLCALLLNLGINALAFAGLFFLPRQKLDTQQQRSFGGYTKCASAAIVCFGVVLFTYSITVSAMTFIPGLSCHRLAGGAGC